MVLTWSVWGLAMAAWNMVERSESDQPMQFVARNEDQNIGTLTIAENAERP